MLTDSAWTRRRFLGALVASAVAAGVKIPGLPAADRMAEAPIDLGSQDSAIHYFLVIHPSVAKPVGQETPADTASTRRRFRR